MPEYTFSAKNRNGKTISGSRTGASPEEIASQLISEGLIPIEINLNASKASVASPGKRRWGRNKVSKDELHLMCRQMYSLTHAGIPLAMAVIRVAETTHNPVLADALQQIVVSLNKGSSLHVAMHQFPKIFDDFFVNLIVVGENSGNLDRIFLQLGEYLEMEVEVQKKIKAALRYPIMVVSAIIIALVIINFFVLPAFVKLFDTFKGELPLPTRILMATSNFLVNYWYIILFVIAAIIISIRMYIKSPQGALVWGRLVIKIPIIGWLIHRILLARFSRLFALVLRAGIPAVEGIRLVGASTGNVYVGLKIREVTDYIERGNTISSAIDKTHLFPPLVTQMIVLGEESGSIDTLLDEVSEFYEREINYDIVRLSDSLEPILLVVIGAMVLILALGIFLPMWNLASVVNKR